MNKHLTIIYKPLQWLMVLDLCMHALNCSLCKINIEHSKIVTGEHTVIYLLLALTRQRINARTLTIRVSTKVIFAFDEIGIRRNFFILIEMSMFRCA
jgi:hypothetical protein